MNGPDPMATNEQIAPKKATVSTGNGSVGWKDLPRKKALAVIVLARLSEPLTQTSLNAYLFYQVKWFDPTQTTAQIAWKVGLLQSSFTGAQFLTAMAWGRIADSSAFGRKRVILCGLCGTFLSIIGYAFSTTFTMALICRILGGITNGNVGVLRTIYQSRAFILLPMTFNIGVTIGPSIGGMLSDLAGSYPNTFGKVPLFVNFPYAAPNLFSAFILFCGITFTWLCLEETLDSRMDKRDLGLELGKKISEFLASFSLFSKRDKAGYERVASSAEEAEVNDMGTESSSPTLYDSRRSSLGESNLAAQQPPPPRRPRYTQRLPFGRIFTRNVVFTLMAHFLLAFHLGTFNSLWPVFLSTPTFDPSLPTPPGSLTRRLPFIFTGGIGFSSQQVGPVMSILGTIGIFLQLLVYPRLSARLGTTTSLRTFLTCFPIVYFAVPFLSLIPSTDHSPDSHSKAGPAIWVAITAVIGLHVLGRTFALPAQTILINNCSPHPSVLGTVHGIGQTASSAARTLGPALGALIFGIGLEKGVVAIVWWVLSGVAVLGLLATWLWVREGNGHEIWLEGLGYFERALQGLVIDDGAAVADNDLVLALLDAPLVTVLVPETGGVLGLDVDLDRLLAAGVELDLGEALELLYWPIDARLLLGRDVDLNNLGALDAARVGHGRLDGDELAVLGMADLEVAKGKGGVAEAVTKGEEHGAVGGLVEAVADVDVLAVQGAGTLGAEIEEGRVVLAADGEGQGELAAGVDVAKEDVGDGVARLVAAVPRLQDGGDVAVPGHLDGRARLHDDDRVLVGGGHGGDEVVHGRGQLHVGAVVALGLPVGVEPAADDDLVRVPGQRRRLGDLLLGVDDLAPAHAQGALAQSHALGRDGRGRRAAVLELDVVLFALGQLVRALLLDCAGAEKGVTPALLGGVVNDD
ncbi:hypothetical protein PpBr36_01550 [Pyricularia pennisetigena]|uniref:hypothetical protein n=1 Tax=Pyricularia pennisetigena TaxID=1578925 RepID=UPI00114F11A4|nr:hypothetical protein PpBr36_01550 [Pyricularia pennisetigena]TLS29344.1 hypothetical protein PpBr36_01550 [Pyricularia pennisetigena]